MRSSQDPINGLKTYLTEWGITDEAHLKQLDKDAKAEVDQAVKESKESPEPDLKDFWTDIYVRTLPLLGLELTSYSTRVPSPLRCAAVTVRRSTLTRLLLALATVIPSGYRDAPFSRALA